VFDFGILETPGCRPEPAGGAGGKGLGGGGGGGGTGGAPATGPST